jgi:hypothetical protein
VAIEQTSEVQLLAGDSVLSLTDEQAKDRTVRLVSSTGREITRTKMGGFRIDVRNGTRLTVMGPNASAS